MSVPKIHTHLLPSLIPPQVLSGTTAVVIDVLRATTTAVAALAAGASGLIPTQTIEEANALADQLNPRPLLGGERGGLPIDGFDLGNSPAAYGKNVQGRWIVFTTTNGTKAIHACKDAASVILAAFTNLSAICDRLADCHRIHLVCAGTHGHITQEDVLLAGAILDQLTGGNEHSLELNDESRLALDTWKAQAGQWTGKSWLVDRLRISHGGQNLLKTGQEADVSLASQIDQATVIPVWNRIENRITCG
jgi:2-phosphosulfolactate phosphatase